MEANRAKRKRRRDLCLGQYLLFRFQEQQKSKYVLFWCSFLLSLHPISGTKHTKDDCIGPLELFVTFRCDIYAIMSFLQTIRWWLNYTESDCFHWCDNFISTGNEVAQLHTLVDWMRDEDLDQAMSLNTPAKSLQCILLDFLKFKKKKKSISEQ